MKHSYRYNVVAKQAATLRANPEVAAARRARAKAGRVFDYLLSTYRFWDSGVGRYRWLSSSAQDAAWELKQIWGLTNDV